MNLYFKYSKTVISQNCLLTLPKFHIGPQSYTGASEYQFSSAIAQGNMLLLASCSRKLATLQWGCAIQEHEGLSMVETLR